MSRLLKEFEKIPCALCGSNRYLNLTHKGQFDIKIYVVICPNCGLTYLNPRWKKEEYLSFYEKEYDVFYNRVQKTELTIESTNFIELILERLLALDPSLDPRNILDVGAGYGQSLLFLKESIFKKANYFAIESSKEGCEQIQKHGIKVVSNDVETEWEGNNASSFDLIIMRHVLEHLLNPVHALKKISVALTNDGLLYLAVPDSLNPSLPLSSYFFRAVHTYYFNIKSLRGIVEKGNLHVVKMIETKDKEIYLIAKKRTTSDILIQKSFKDQYLVFLKILTKERLQKKFKDIISMMSAIKRAIFIL